MSSFEHTFYFLFDHGTLKKLHITWINSYIYFITEPLPPDSVDLDVSVQYYPKRCPKAKAMQKIRANLVKQFEQLAKLHALPDFCDVSTSCNVSNVEIECGETPDATKRKRRQANGGNVVMTISFTVSVGPSADGNDPNTVNPVR